MLNQNEEQKQKQKQSKKKKKRSTPWCSKLIYNSLCDYQMTHIDIDAQ